MSASYHSDLVRLSFSLDEQSIKNLCTTTEGEKFKKIQQTLYSVGITLDIDPSSKELSITLDNDEYAHKVKRNAGRLKEPIYDKLTKEAVHYSDFVYMMQTMTDSMMCEQLQLSRTSFYRRKKAVKESIFYKSLDINRTWDLPYLKSDEFKFLDGYV